MEDKYPIKEIKVMEGVYIWKPEKNTNNNSNDNINNNTQNNINNNSSKTNDKTNNFIGNKSIIGENEYICHGKDELIKIYEIEFEELGNRILALFQSNEDMMEFDPNDYDLIQAREENLELIDKKLAEIVNIPGFVIISPPEFLYNDPPLISNVPLLFISILLKLS